MQNAPRHGERSAERTDLCLADPSQLTAQTDSGELKTSATNSPETPTAKPCQDYACRRGAAQENAGDLSSFGKTSANISRRQISRKQPPMAFSRSAVRHGLSSSRSKRTYGINRDYDYTRASFSSD